MTDAGGHLEAKAFDLLCYMVTSAANLPTENRLYGPYRLIDAAARLVTLLEEEGVRSDRLADVRARIQAGQFMVMEDEQAFCQFLHELALSLVPLLD